MKISYLANANIVDFTDYMFYHNSLDEFIWLIKLAYSPKEHIKRRKYSSNILFQYYIKNTIDFDRLGKHVSSPKTNNPDRFIYYLKQGWYNELASAYPYNESQDDAGTNISLPKGNNLWQTELFPSWAITKTYYSIYAHYNSLLFTHIKKCNTYSHRNPTNHFNNVLLHKFGTILLKYPFNIMVSDIEKPLTGFRYFDRKEWQYQYANYPRELDYDKKYIALKTDMDNATPEEIEFVISLLQQHHHPKSNTIYDVERQYYKNLKRVRSILKCRAPVNIVDLMYLFRTWANYTGSDTYIDLQKGGYLRFLQKNLYVLNYFFAGLNELAAIMFLGENRFTEVFNGFYKSFIETREEMVSGWYYLPFINRIRIYQHLKLINVFDVNALKPQNDILTFI